MKTMFATVLLAGTAIAAVDVDVIVTEGEQFDKGIVDSLNAPFTNGAGDVGFVMALDDGRRAIWFDSGPIFFSDDVADTLTGGEGTMGISDAGDFIYSPSFNGNDAVFGNNGLIQEENTQAPGYPSGVTNTFNSRPQMIDDGTAYWVSGINETGGTSTEARVLYRRDPNGTIVPVLASDDVIEGFDIDRPSGIGFDYKVSGDGAHMINEVLLGTNSTTDDGSIVVDGSIIARESLPSGQGDNWDNFDSMGINASGNFIFAGDTDGASSSDEFIAYNGNIEIREGDTIDGILLGSSTDASAINDNNEIAFMFDGADGEEHLFFGEGGALASAIRLLSTGEEIDVNGDTIADYLVTDFNASNVVGPGLDLAEDGYIHLEVDMIAIGGADEIEAIIRIAVPAPGAAFVLGLAALGRRRR